MQSENPRIADFVKLLNSAAGTFAGMGREAREGARERFKEAFGGMTRSRTWLPRPAMKTPHC